MPGFGQANTVQKLEYQELIIVAQE